MQRIYDVVFDRDMQNGEREQLATYLSEGILDTTKLANQLIGSAAFTSNYGTLSNVGFVQVLYQNAYGRNASVSEMQSWLAKLISGNVTRDYLVIAIADSAEHQVVGNEHVTTNVTSGKYLHSTDKAAAIETVDRLYRVLLNRDPSVSEVATKVNAITGGVENQFQVANDILGSPAFSALYGSLSMTDLVTQFFLNALGRIPTPTEASFWTSAMGAGTTTADFAVALAVNQSFLSSTAGAGLAITGGVGDDFMTGSAGDDTIDGGAGNDVITSFSGRDTIIGGAGSDIMIGGTGDDTYVVDNAGDVVVENAGEGNDTVKTALASYTLGANVENMIYTGTATFTGTGNSLNNVIIGGDGANILDGGAGADTLVGGTGNDIYIVDNASDVVTENAGEGTDTIKTSLATYSLASLANVENLTYTGTAAFTGTGNASANVITGGSGNDTLDGGAGADTLIGGLGDDTYIVDNAGDIVMENAGEGTDTIKAALASYILGSNVENLTYTGFGTFTGTGNELDNIITGGSGSNRLAGGSGNDTLIGGASADTFVYMAHNGADTIVGFTASGTAHDTLAVDSKVFSDWAHLLAAATQSGSDVIITADADDRIILKNLTVSALQSSNVQFL